MKNRILNTATCRHFILAMLCVVCFNSFVKKACAQPEWDHFTFYMNKGNWETEITNDSKYAIQVFISHKNFHQSVCIQNFNLRQEKLRDLKEYINKLKGYRTVDDICSYGKEEWILYSFYVFSFPDSLESSKNKVDIIDLMSKLRMWR